MKKIIVFIAVLLIAGFVYADNSYERLCYDLEKLGFSAPPRPQCDPEVITIEQNDYVDYDNDYRQSQSDLTDYDYDY